MTNVRFAPSLGQNRKRSCLSGMSVLPSRADIVRPPRHVRLVPTGDSCIAAKSLFDHLIGRREERCRNLETERAGCLEIDDQMEARGLLDRKLCSFCPLQELRNIISRSAI